VYSWFVSAVSACVFDNIDARQHFFTPATTTTSTIVDPSATAAAGQPSHEFCSSTGRSKMRKHGTWDLLLPFHTRQHTRRCTNPAHAHVVMCCITRQLSQHSSRTCRFPNTLQQFDKQSLRRHQHLQRQTTPPHSHNPRFHSHSHLHRTSSSTSGRAGLSSVSFLAARSRNPGPRCVTARPQINFHKGGGTDASCLIDSRLCGFDAVLVQAKTVGVPTAPVLGVVGGVVNDVASRGVCETPIHRTMASKVGRQYYENEANLDWFECLDDSLAQESAGGR